MAISIFADPPLGVRTNTTTQSSVGTVNSTYTSYVSASHKVSGPSVLTTLTLTNLPQTVVNGTEYQGTLLWTFPQAQIFVRDAYFSLAQKTTSIVADTINASVTGALAIGSATASNVALTTTMANFLPSTAFTSSATINVAGTAVTAELDANNDGGEAFFLDGSSTAVGLYLNSSYATTGDVDADGTQTWTGTIEIYWFLDKYNTGISR
jgi:hypothetical protein